MKVLLISLLTFFSLNAFANGDSGCGFGSLIITRNSKGLQLLSLTSNHSTGSQMFGITTGTSNCSSSDLVSNEQEIQYFAAANFNELTKNIARGEGETLSAFAVLYGCASPQAINEFSTSLKQNMSDVVPSEKTSSMELVSNVSHQISKNGYLSQLCSAKL